MTLQDKINAANDGDIIIIKPGNHTESVCVPWDSKYETSTPEWDGIVKKLRVELGDRIKEIENDTHKNDFRG